MKYSWLHSVLPVAAIFSFRMLGLFMLIPVFTVFAKHLQGATPTLIGIALGSYGLSQGILQIPFGFLSDRFGRKPILTLGLLLFAAGSLLGALADSIYVMIFARILQGTGAIGSVLIALVADLTPDEDRTKAMAVIGATIGLSFSLAMVLSPLLTQYYGLASIFYFTTLLALVGLVLLHVVIPSPKKKCFHSDSAVNFSLFKTVLKNKQLQRLNAGIFFQHFILTATFYAIPIVLGQQLHQSQWSFYLPLMFFSFVAMVPFILVAEKKQRMKPVFLLSVLITGLSQLLLAMMQQSGLLLYFLMFFYFVAFNILEATLPSLTSKLAAATSKGTAMGIYSSSQFLGIFVGGTSAGMISQWAGISGIFFVNALITLIWLMIAATMKNDIYLATLILSYNASLKDEAKLLTQFQHLPGIKEIFINKEEQVIYLRIDKTNYQFGSAEKMLESM